MINIFWVYKSDLFIRAIEILLKQKRILLAGLCDTPKDALEHFARIRADLVIMEMNWGRQNTSVTDLLEVFRPYDLDIKIILVTSFYEDEIVKRLDRLGAKGYFFKHDHIENIANCIKNVHQAPP